MPRGPAKFKQDDIKRACKAVMDAGAKIARVDVEPDTGKISVVTTAGTVHADPQNEWDDVLNQ